MKTIIFLLFLAITSFAQAKDLAGSFQIEEDQSVMELFKKTHQITGSVEIKENFSASTLSVESQAATFESTEFIGTISDFSVKGYITLQGTARLVTLRGKYFGVINNEFGKVRVAFSFADEDLHLKVFATKPSETATSLHREVRDIVRH